MHESHGKRFKDALVDALVIVGVALLAFLSAIFSLAKKA